MKHRSQCIEKVSFRLLVTVPLSESKQNAGVRLRGSPVADRGVNVFLVSKSRFPSLGAVTSKTDELVTICLSILLKAVALSVPPLVMVHCLGQSQTNLMKTHLRTFERRFETYIVKKRQSDEMRRVILLQHYEAGLSGWPFFDHISEIWLFFRLVRITVLFGFLVFFWPCLKLVGLNKIVLFLFFIGLFTLKIFHL